MATMNFLYPLPPSILINSMSIVNVIALAKIGWSEVKGVHMKYSKFNTSSSSSSSSSSPSPPSSKSLSISSRHGMLWSYTPAFLAAFASFFVVPSDDLRFLLIKSALAIHFFKRVFEVLFIHKYSGEMAIETVFTITLSYFSSTALVIDNQYLSLNLPEPVFDLKYPGILLFIIGIIGNLYHHYLLSNLRKEDNSKKEYKIPKGGLFNTIICPHYLFEIFVFWSFFMISQTIFSLSFAMGSTLYLMGRSYATRSWYLSKFEDFPKHVKALIPFVF